MRTLYIILICVVVGMPVFAKHNGFSKSDGYMFAEGLPIPSVQDGVVTYVGWDSPMNHNIGYGYYVRVNNLDKTQSYYIHLHPKVNVAFGEKIKKGDIVGNVGGTGDIDGANFRYMEKDTNHITKVEPSEESRQYLFDYYNK